MADDDIEMRAENYEARLIASGGTDALMLGLVKSMKRSRLIIKILAGSLAFDMLLSLSIGVLVLRTEGVANDAADTARQARANNVSIQTLLGDQDKARYQSCLDGVVIIKRLNRGNRRQLRIEKTTSYTTSVGVQLGKRKADAYRDAIITPLPICKK